MPLGNKQVYYDGLDIEILSSDELDTYVNEICEDLSPDYTGVKKTSNHEYEFKINNLIYKVEIVESVTLDTNKKLLEIKFKLMNNPNAPQKNDFQNDLQYQIALKKSQIGITGTGNGIKILKKVIATFIETIKDLKPDYVGFSADESNRQKLYTKIINTVQKHMPFNYTHLKNHPIDNYELNPGEFWLEISYK